MSASVRVEAPVRVADVGGWTDTWFAGSGAVCHLAMSPGVTVTASPRTDDLVGLRAPDVGLDALWADPPGQHPLLEAAVGTTRGLDLHVSSAAPPGASLGTSASVVVAILAAIDALQGVEVDPARIAVRAHEIETVDLGRESGVQDQWAAALGGINLLTVDPYPHVVRRRVQAPVDPSDRLLTVVMGAHDSSAVHAEVIASLRENRRDEVMEHLATLAVEAADALGAGDLPRWGSVLRECTDTQARLHTGLVGRAHLAVIEAARRHGALGWKVNGAGGDGGSLTVLLAEPEERDRLAIEVARLDRSWQLPRLGLSNEGIRVSGGPAGGA